MIELPPHLLIGLCPFHSSVDRSILADLIKLIF